METAIGVFSSRDHAEEALKELRQQGVPEQSIVYLTRSESEAKTIAKDSSGLGELVKTHTTISNKGGELKLTNLNKRVSDLLQMTRLSAVFDVQADEATAIMSFGGRTKSQAVA